MKKPSRFVCIRFSYLEPDLSGVQDVVLGPFHTIAYYQGGMYHDGVLKVYLHDANDHDEQPVIAHRVPDGWAVCGLEDGVAFDMFSVFTSEE